MGFKLGKPEIDGKQQRGFRGIKLRAIEELDSDSD
jgi:hypothetical protein